MEINKAKKTLFIDTNIFVDIFQERTEFLGNSSKVLEKIYNDEFNGAVASHTISNLWYILRKTHSSQNRRIILSSICEYFNVVGMESSLIINAIKRQDFSDFEDCLQDECASKINADYIITKNPKDYEKSIIKAITPEEFLKIFDLGFD